MKFLLLIVFIALLVYFLFPTFISLCDTLGQVIADVVYSIKDAFKDKAEEWKELFLRFK